MKKWWLETAWPWLKDNWWVLLILPVLILAAIAMWSSKWFRSSSLQTIDPTAKADERALKEAQRREEELADENKKLARKLAEVRKKYDALRRANDKKLEDQVEELRQDPERLQQLMLKVGRGERT